MTTEIKSNVPGNGEGKEKEMKEDAPEDKSQPKEEMPADKTEEKVEEKKVEPSPPKPTVHKANFDKDVAYLYQFSRTPLLLSTSPYCLKVETWLRLAGIKYEVSALNTH
ncbi:Failed axon connections protein [Operophtera brumata]|uniref:Failed axon connections protein n=1 Tax=Operophtera brumata TaxID=104452 RepID=A0A0L7LVX6_OPEBR|nr:Failed axon connections protein [Operophtera brumata]